MVFEWRLTGAEIKHDCNVLDLVYTHNFVEHLKYVVSYLDISSQVLKNFLDTAEAEVKSLTTLYIEVVSCPAFHYVIYLRLLEV